jgi:hypothetical protein
MGKPVKFAKITEQGVTFVVVQVEARFVDNYYAGQRVIASFKQRFGVDEVVLYSVEPQGKASYFGRSDIVRFLSDFPSSSLPWRELVS